MAATTRHRLLTPPPRAGGAAIAIIIVEAESPASLDSFLARVALSATPGAAPLRGLFGVDEGLVVRNSPTTAQLMPHGGSAVLGALSAALAASGCLAASGPADPRTLYSEAEDLIEACALDTLARAPSPLAIDVILRQRARWRHPALPRPTHAEATRARPLNHLLDPPTVLLLGRPNIGKSALTNAMAGRAVSVVADEPGTTRDHVGVLIDLAGLVVRWIDAPGLTDSPASDLDHAAIDLARTLITSADLVLLCADCVLPLPPPVGAPVHAPMLEVGLRADLAPRTALPTAALRTSALARQGLTELALAVRRALIPEELLAAPPMWRFHASLPA